MLYFTMWMLGYPLVCVAGKHFAYLRGDWKDYDAGVRGVAALIEQGIWAGVGYLIYVR